MGWLHSMFSLEGRGVLLSTHTQSVHQDPRRPGYPVRHPKPWPPSSALSPLVLLAFCSGRTAGGGCIGVCVLVCVHARVRAFVYMYVRV